MRHIVTIYCLLVVCWMSAQEPIWLSSAGRNLIAPNDTYYSGYAQNVYIASQSETYIRTTKDKAQAYLAENILVSIKSSTESTISEREVDGRLQNVSDFSASVKAHAQAELPNTNIEYYIDKSGKIIHAFAYVKRSDVCQFYIRKIADVAQNIEYEMTLIERLASKGQKQAVLHKLDSIDKSITQIKTDEYILSAMQSDAVAPSNDLKRKLDDLKLKFDILNLYVEITEPNNESTSKAFTHKLLDLLANERCTIVADKMQADYYIIINATTKKHGASNPDFSFMYAEGMCEIQNAVDKSIVLHKNVSVKAGDILSSKASEKALSSAAQKIFDIVKDVLF